MTLTNHMLTGSLLAKVLPYPVIAIPLALVSHFILDVLPHFGIRDVGTAKKYHRLWKFFTGFDLLVATVVSVWLVGSGHILWWLIGLVACSPDLVWAYRFVVQEKFGTLPPGKVGAFSAFHGRIQKYERVWGVGVELAYGVFVFALVWR